MIQRVLSTVEPNFHQSTTKVTPLATNTHISLLVIMDIDQDSTTNLILCQINCIFRPPSARPSITRIKKENTDISCEELTKNSLGYTCWQQLEEYNGWNLLLVIK